MYKKIYWYHRKFKMTSDINLEFAIMNYCLNVKNVRELWESYLVDKEYKIPTIKHIIIQSKELYISHGLCSYFINHFESIKGVYNMHLVTELIFKNLLDGVEFKSGAFVSNTIDMYEEPVNYLAQYTDESITKILSEIFDVRVESMQKYKEEVIWCDKYLITVARIINFFKPFKY